VVIHNHSFILNENGDFWGTGKNDVGQLGTGDNDNRNIWVKVF
jgi:alpha-tubulin suppressor-like RCC1 family protein